MISAAPNLVATSEALSEADGSVRRVVGVSGRDTTGFCSASGSNARRRPRRVGAVVFALVACAFSAQLATNAVVVKSGDTLSKFAADYGVSVQAIVAANGIDDPNLIRVGQALILPSPTADASHTVRPGDTLSGIAVIYASTPTALAARNQLVNPDLIRVGEVLVIPRTVTPTPLATPVAAPLANPVAATVAIAPVVSGPPFAPRTALLPTTTAAAPDRVLPSTIPPATVAQVTVPSGGLVSTMWVVQPGDTIASIAARFGLVPRRLASANAVSETDPLLLGQRIYVPQS